MDPAKAILGNNGMSGKIGNFLGAKEKVMATQLEFTHAYNMRKQKRMEEKIRQMTPDNSNDILPTSNVPPVDISSNDKWQNNVGKSGGFAQRGEPKPVTSIASRKPSESHVEKAVESKDNPPIGLTA